MVRTIATPTATGEQRLRMSYEEYLAYVDEDTHSEWVDGEVTIFMPPADRHQAITTFLAMLFQFFVDSFELGIVRVAPEEMRLREGRSYREPDLLVLLNEHIHRLTTQGLVGPADLVVEILSPESTTRDQQEKRREYAEAGIPEYWIIDGRPGRGAIDCLVLSAEGTYEPVAPDDGGRLHSRVLPGFWLRQDWFTGGKMPNTVAVMREIVPAMFGGK